MKLQVHIQRGRDLIVTQEIDTDAFPENGGQQIIGFDGYTVSVHVPEHTILDDLKDPRYQITEHRAQIRDVLSARIVAEYNDQHTYREVEPIDDDFEDVVYGLPPTQEIYTDPIANLRVVFGHDYRGFSEYLENQRRNWGKIEELT